MDSPHHIVKQTIAERSLQHKVVKHALVLAPFAKGAGAAVGGD